jgi:hypothetical protein
MTNSAKNQQQEMPQQQVIPQPSKKPFIEPAMEKVDVSFTEAGPFGPVIWDGVGYQS